MSAAGLIRRKSLAQPGVATRHSRKELKPEARQDNDQLWKPQMMGTSPLAKLSRYDDLEPNLLLPPSIAQDRAHTPTGDEYSNLGNLKRGSLMVMNGAVSPAPSFISGDFLGERQSEEEYFTASENESAPAIPFRALPALPTSNTQYTLDSSSHSLEDFRLSDQQGKSMAVSANRNGSPLKREIRAASSIGELDGETALITYKPRTQSSAIALIARSENHSLFSNENSVEDLRIYQSHPRIVSQSAVSLAAEYMMELPPSPHKANAKEQGMLLLEPSPGSSVSRSGIAREDYYNSSQNTQHEDREPQVYDEISAHTALRSHPPNATLPLKSALKSMRSSQVKTDSGYCSSASTGVETGPTFEMDPLNLSTVDSVAPSAPKGDVASTPTVEAKKLVPKPPILRIKSDISEKWPTFPKPEGDDVQETPEHPKRPKAERTKSWKKSIRRSLSRSRTAETTTDRNLPASLPGSSLSLDSAKPRKLQKKRPLSQPRLAIRDSHDPNAEVPQVPSSTFLKFSKRVAISPGLQHLDRTYEDATITNTRQGSASPAPASESLPDLKASYLPDAQHDNVTTTANRTSKQATSDQAAPQTPIHRHGLSRMSFRRASVSSREDEEEIGSDEIVGATDFGTVAKSLGSGPYDIAKGNQPHQPRSTQSKPVQYPHQLGADHRQFGPREGWDAETASRFAQMRSRERAAATAAAEREPVPAQRPFISSRSRSYHEDSPMRFPQPSSEHRKPKSAHGSAPQGQGHMQRQGQVHDYQSAQQEYLRPPTFITTTSALRPRTANADPVAYGQRPARQQFHPSSGIPPMPRPKTANAEPVVYGRAPRSESPVKNMVGLLEARAALAPTPSPTLTPSPNFDWSEQSRLWGERKMNAQGGVRTASSEYSESITSTTTGTTYVSGSRSQPGYPTVQTSYSSSTPRTATRTVYSAFPPTTTTRTTHTNYLATPVSKTSNNHTSTVSSTSSSRIPRTPTYSQPSTQIQQPKWREQTNIRPQSQHHARPSFVPGSNLAQSQSQPQPQPQQLQQQQQPQPRLQQQSKRTSSGNIFGQFGGGGGGAGAGRFTGEKVVDSRSIASSGGKRNITPRTHVIRSSYGVDVGDIPARRNAPI